MTTQRPSESVEMYCPDCDRSYGEHTQHCPEDGTRLVRLTEASDSLLGVTLDERFRIRDRLGSGGMGTVYRAHQLSIGRDVAVKVIDGTLARDKQTARRFLREAKLCSRLCQPNTVTLLDFGQTADGVLYLVTELLVGRTLGEVLKADGPMTIARMSRIGMQLCEALEAAHALSIVHRDLKPSNIIVLDAPVGRDVVKVLDFGLAKSLTHTTSTTVTKSDAIMGTPAYISPEAVTGKETDARSDLYSLGVILYELVTGRLPFAASNSSAMMAKHAYDAPDPLGDRAPPALVRAIERLLAKSPEDRIQSATELRETLALLKTAGDQRISSPSNASNERPPGVLSTLESGATVDVVGDTVERTTGDTAGFARRPRLALWLGAGAIAVAITAYFLVRGDEGRRESAPGDGVPSIVSEPKTDEPKTDRPTTDEPKTDEPKTDEPKTDRPTTDEPKTDEPKTDEPKTDEPKTDEPKTDEPKTDRSKTDEPKTDRPKTDEPTTDRPKTDRSKTDRPKTDRPTTDRPTTDRPTTDRPKTDRPKTDRPKTDRSKTDKPKTDKPKTDKPKTDKPKTDDRPPVNFVETP